jgi:hypothetical protein
MGKMKKQNPGSGAKCNVLTKFLYEKQNNVEKDHRTFCILSGAKTVTINCKQQICFLFNSHCVEYYAVKCYFTIEEEGDVSGFFFPHEVAKATGQGRKQKDVVGTKTKKILFKLLRDGTVPRVQHDSNGNDIMTIEENYIEFMALYSFAQ